MSNVQSPPPVWQEELATLRAEYHQDSEDLFKKIVQASQVGGWALQPELVS
jgi:hypothetical protein